MSVSQYAISGLRLSSYPYARRDSLAEPRATCTDGFAETGERDGAVHAKVTLEHCRFALVKLSAATEGHRWHTIPRNEEPGAGCISVAAS